MKLMKAALRRLSNIHSSKGAIMATATMSETKKAAAPEPQPAKRSWKSILLYVFLGFVAIIEVFARRLLLALRTLRLRVQRRWRPRRLPCSNR